jgi:prenyl protein peptidase
MLAKRLNFEHLSSLTSVLSCFSMGSFYVISLYLWSKQNRFNRNEPSVIKRRFISVILTSILSLLFVYFLSQEDKNDDNNDSNSHPLNIWIGFRFDFINVMKSVIITLFLTVILFSGPIVQHFVRDYLDFLHLMNRKSDKKSNNNNDIENNKQLKNVLNYIYYLNKQFFSKKNFNQIIAQDLCDLGVWRNYIISPFTEEFVFRSCMLPLVLPTLFVHKTIYITPLFFGIAHLHHMIEGILTTNVPFKFILLQNLFQFSYTYLFGLYSSFLFLRTGNFLASFLNHSFCNFMGFPNINELINDFNGRMRLFITFSYFFGLFMFWYLLISLTNPQLYDNHVFNKFY